MANISSRIRIKKDTQANWTSENPLLLDGEIAIVVTSKDIKYKVGDGSNHFNDLEYVFENEIVTTNLIAGTNCSASGTCAVATGLNCYADNTCSEAKGFKAQSNKNYSYVWNGDTTRTSNYQSKEEGSYCINPSGTNPEEKFYIGDNNLPTVITNQIDSKLTNIETLEDSEKVSIYEVAEKLNSVISALKKSNT